MGNKKIILKLIIFTIMVIGFTNGPRVAAAADEQPKAQQAENGKSSPNLTRTRWQLIELAGKPAPAGVRDKPVKMVLIHNCKDFRARGFSGCNRFSTTYEQSSGQLSFKMPAAGRKECRGFMELEEAFLTALVSSREYRINDQTLSIFNEENQPILRFKAAKR